MLYNFILPYIHSSHIANLLHYITFRMGIAMSVSLILSFLIGNKLITKLKYLQKKGQPIREDGPISHKSKTGTPTMGGIMIVFTTVFSCILFVDITNIYFWLVLLIMLSFSILGFVDDYLKIVQNNSKGISASKKIIIQVAIGIIASSMIIYSDNSGYATYLSFPFFKNALINISYFYIPFVICVIVGASNAVNLTDGLDGLAIMPVAIVAGCFALIAYLVGGEKYAKYLHLIYVPNTAELAIVCSSIIGSCLGFLWYNSQPAQIFMGDTGSLSLGGTLGIISVILKHEIVLAILGGIFVIEAMSVIIQVYYFKISCGKRVFLMAPIHHHFEKLGWPESKVVVRFWIISIIFALIGLSSLKLR